MLSTVDYIRSYKILLDNGCIIYSGCIWILTSTSLSRYQSHYAGLTPRYKPVLPFQIYRDSCVNQLLTLLDGTREMNNILVVCLTNRKDMLDDALLRPGRLEVHLEIGLPTAEGRTEILDILFLSLVEEGYVTPTDRDLWIAQISKRTDGCSGADLSGVMRNAAAHAIDRWQGDHCEGRGSVNSLRYEWDDFDRAVQAIDN